MTHVLAVLGGGKTDVLVVGAAAAVAEIAHAQVRQISLPTGLNAGQAAAQVLRALRSAGTVLAVLAGDEVTRPVWQRVVQHSARPVILVPAAARGSSRRSAGYWSRWTGRQGQRRRWPRRRSSSPAAGSNWWCCTCSTPRQSPVLGPGRARQAGLGAGVPGPLLRTARRAAGTAQRGAGRARPGRGGGRAGRPDRARLVTAPRPGPGAHACGGPCARRVPVMLVPMATR